MTNISFFSFILISILYSLTFAPNIEAKENPQVTKKEFRDVAGELRCPTCTGLSVLDSEAKFSVQIKDEVRSQIEKGVPKAEILDFFKQRYGPWILRKPPHEGFNVIIWWIPIAILICGPILVWFFIWRKKKVVASYGVRGSQDIIDELTQHVEKVKAQREN